MNIINYVPPPTVKRFIRDFNPSGLFYNWIVGPVGCLAPETLVVTEDGPRAIADIDRPTRVLSWNEKTYRFELSWCGGSFPKGKDYLYRVTTQHGEFDAAGYHLLLCADGSYRRVADLSAGQVVRGCSFDLLLTSGVSGQSASPEDAPGWLRTIVGSMGHYADAARLHGLRLLRGVDSDLVFAPSLVDAQRSVLLDAQDVCGQPDGHLVQSRARSHQDQCDGLTQIGGSVRQGRHLRCGEEGCVRVSVGERIVGSARRFGRSLLTSVGRWIGRRVGRDKQAFIYSSSDRTILKIERRDVKQEFWDLQVLDTHNYVTTDGCIHHNSGKTTGLFFKLVYMAGLQAPSPDGIRRTRAVIVRNTMPQLKDTTLVSWNMWFKDGQAGRWNITDKIFMLRFADVECEVMFRPLDTPDDVRRVLSLEVTFVILDEFVEIPQAIVDALGARVGRYKQPDGTQVTNWGMWGASNPSTEDNWWFDYLHNRLPDNAKYFLQPSALGPGAENLANLPGQRGYYENLVKGKNQIWINQFVNAEWGYSISGTPVVAGFNALTHIAKSRLNFNPMRKLLVGFDPGLGGSALIFGQQDEDGRLSILGELVQRGMGAERIIKEKLRPYISERFPGADVLVLPDPAASLRAQSDEKTVTKVIGKYYKLETESNNRLPLRLDAIDYFVSRLVEGTPALQIDPFHCPILIRALKGGWRYAMDTKKDSIKGAEPEDNQWTHPGDAFGYLCRYLHKRTLKLEQYGAKGVAPFVPPKRFGSNYHLT